MKKEKLFLSTIAPAAGVLARKHGFGLELADFCTASKLDVDRRHADSSISSKIWGVCQIAIHAPFNELFPCAIDPKAQELARYRYLQTVMAAKDYQAKTIVIHSGYAPSFYFDCWFEEKSVEFWRELIKKVPDGMTICLENVLETRPDPLLHVLEAVNDPRLRACLDVGHISAYSKIPAMTWLETLAPWISHFHLHNNAGDADTHAALDEGNVPMEQFLREAGQLCPDATYTLELADPMPSVDWLMKTGILE